MRGGTHLWGSFGTRLKAEGDSEQRTTVLSVERHKDHDAVGLRWGFKLEITDIEEFAGETSLVLVEDEAVSRADQGREADGHGRRKRLRAFKYALTEGAGSKVAKRTHSARCGCADHRPMAALFRQAHPIGKHADAKRETV